MAVAGWHVDVIAPPFVSLLAGNPHLRNLATLQVIAPNWPADWWKLAWHLRRQRYDAVLVPFSYPRQLLLASALSGAPHRIAMWGGIPGRLTLHRCLRSQTYENPRPYAETILRLLEPLNIPAQGIEPELYLEPEEEEAGKRLLDTRFPWGTRVGIHPLCLGNTCNLPIGVYRELARRILEQTDWSVLVTGTTGDREQVSDWAALPHAERLWISCGQGDLRSLASVLKNLDLFIVPSTGPLHIARALGVPTLTPFCPQVPVCAKIWGHAPLEFSALEPSAPQCSPAARHGMHCDFRGALSADDLLARARQILAPRANASASTETP
jgi:ADP-heptose:LPS heptosyltransferase